MGGGGVNTFSHFVLKHNNINSNVETSFNNEAIESQTLLRRWVILGGVKTRDAQYLKVIFNGQSKAFKVKCLLKTNVSVNKMNH